LLCVVQTGDSDEQINRLLCVVQTGDSDEQINRLEKSCRLFVSSCV